METRYEEYHNQETILPCVPFLHIHRRFDRPSQATNWHDNPEIQLCVEGEGFVLLDGERHPFQAGDLIVVNSNQVHFTGTDTALTYHCLILDDTFCRMANLPYQQFQFATRFQDEEIKNSILSVVELYQGPEDPCKVARLLTTLMTMLWNWARSLLPSPTASPPPPTNSQHAINDAERVPALSAFPLLRR